MKHFLFAVMIGASVANLSACGFTLRGNQTLTSKEQTYIPIKIVGASNHQILDNQLKHNLKLLGYTSDNNASITNIHLENIRFNSYRLVGVLTEIRTTLTATARYTLPNGVVHQSPLLVERSYQYNENDVSTSDKQASRVQAWLYESLATRISEQYDTLYKTDH